MKKWIYLSIAILFCLSAIAFGIWGCVLYLSKPLKDMVMTPKIWMLYGIGGGCIIVSAIFGELFYINGGDEVIYEN